MYNNRPYQIYRNNNRNAFIPLVLGGVIGYGIGNNNRPNFYPYPVPIIPSMPYYPPFFSSPYYQQNFIYPPYRKK